MDIAKYTPLWASENQFEDESSDDDYGIENKVLDKAVKLASAWGANAKSKKKRLCDRSEKEKQHTNFCVIQAFLSAFVVCVVTDKCKHFNLFVLA